MLIVLIALQNLYKYELGSSEIESLGVISTNGAYTSGLFIQGLTLINGELPFFHYRAFVACIG